LFFAWSYYWTKSITASEYKKIKQECENTIAKCEADLKNLNKQTEEKLDIHALAALAVENLKKLDLLYLNADIVGKRQLMGSIFYEKWTFSDGSHRTPKVNELVDLIYQINSNLGHKKKRGLNIRKNIESSKVPNKKIT